jgi:hypothetical protein
MESREGPPDKDGPLQIDPLMAAIEQNEGMITGVEIARS